MGPLWAGGAPDLDQRVPGLTGEVTGSQGSVLVNPSILVKASSRNECCLMTTGPTNLKRKGATREQEFVLARMQN
jgi:hypothetical protein